MDNNITNNNLSITATPVEGKNYVHLEWTNLGKGYTYTVYSKGESEQVYQSIPSKTNVKVLNVYPGKGNNLKGWMENANSENDKGYGKGLISVDEVDISVFNSNSSTYMKDSSGNWKYDVIYFGGYDSNNNIDISTTAKDIVENYIKEGYGVLFGHDTLGFTNFNYLSSYVNISTNITSSYGSTTVNVTKDGLLTNYPWSIGEIGTKLTIPLSHSTNQFAMGDIWMKYTSNSISSSSEITSLGDKTGTNNFYLTTWNNCAMIQTGHSNGAATEDEQKVLANTLFYLAQLTSDTSCDDHKGQDFAKPDKVNISSASNADKNLNITYSKPNDNGTKYEYYVKASDGNAADDVTSNTVSIVNTSGIAGYSYVVDNIENTEPDNKVITTDLSISAPLSSLDLLKPIYIHIKAIDNAGNYSETTHYEYKYIASLKLDKTEMNLEEGQIDNLTAITDPLAMEVTWTSSDTSVASIGVDPTNGKIIKVNAIKEGTCIITATTTDGSNLSASCKINVTKNTIVNTAHAKGDNTNTSSGEVPIIFNGAAETTLSVVKTADVKSACVGDTFLYTIVVTNTGSKTAKAVVVKDSAPNHIQFTPSGIITTQGEVDPSSTSSNIIINVGDIQPSGTVTITVPATVIL